jgi:hypothetical protein
LNKEEALEFKLMHIDVDDESGLLDDVSAVNGNSMFELNEEVETEIKNATN